MPSPKKQNEFRKTPSLCFAKVVKHPRSMGAKLARDLRKYPMLEPCSCYYDCRQHFTDEQRAAYHLEFWQGNYHQKFKFLTQFVFELNKNRIHPKKDCTRANTHCTTMSFTSNVRTDREFTDVITFTFV